MVDLLPSGGARLAVERLGSGAPAIALHAGVADRRSWAPLARQLDGRLGLVAYDRRGYGETTAVAEPHRHVDDAAVVLDAVAPDAPPWLVGNSQGGRIAIDVALAHPGRVAGLVLIAPAISGAPEEPELTDAERALGDAIDAAYDRGDLDEVNRLDAHLWLDGPEAREGRVAGAPRRLFLDMNGIALRAPDVGEELPPPVPDAFDRLGELRLPVLVVLGDLDLRHMRELGERIVAQAPAARVARLANTAHLPHLERPTQVAAAIGVFADSVER